MYFYKGTKVELYELGPGTQVVDNTNLVDFSVKQPFYLARTKFGMTVAQTGPDVLKLAEELIDKSLK